GVGDGVFGITARRRGHHPVARLEVLHLAPDRFDLARTFEPEPRADAADPAVLLAGRDAEVGAVEARGAHADQDLARRRLRLRHIADFRSILTDDCGFHAAPPRYRVHCSLMWLCGSIAAQRTWSAPSPRRGEGWGEGVQISRLTVTPHPTPLPMGEGADRACRSTIASNSTANLITLSPRARAVRPH